MSEEEGTSLASILACLAWFEDRAADLYGVMASKVSDSQIGALLRVLEYQSRSHKEIMMFVLGVLGAGETVVGRKLCSSLIGPLADTTGDLLSSVSRKDKLSTEELKEMFGMLEFIESSAGEETYVKITAPLIKTLIDATKEEWRRKAVGYLLEEIVREEKFHEKLVAEILKRAAGLVD